ncbi:hypothetical protein D3C72_2528760 [compost metagenome]
MHCATSPVSNVTVRATVRSSAKGYNVMVTVFMTAAAVISFVFLVDFTRTIRDLQRDRLGSNETGGFNV